MLKAALIAAGIAAGPAPVPAPEQAMDSLEKSAMMQLFERPVSNMDMRNGVAAVVQGGECHLVDRAALKIRFIQAKDQIGAVRFLDEHVVALADDEARMTLYDVRSKKSIAQLWTQAPAVSVEINPRNPYQYACGLASAQAQLRDLRKACVVDTLSAHPEKEYNFSHLDVAFGKECVALLEPNGTESRWDLTTLQRMPYDHADNTFYEDPAHPDIHMGRTYPSCGRLVSDYLSPDGYGRTEGPVKPLMFPLDNDNGQPYIVVNPENRRQIGSQIGYFADDQRPIKAYQAEAELTVLAHDIDCIVIGGKAHAGSGVLYFVNGENFFPTQSQAPTPAQASTAAPSDDESDAEGASEHSDQ